MEDLQIIELYFARNEIAIHETDKKYGKLCFSVANNILNHIEDANECVNDTYLGVWNAIPPTRPNSFVAFICRITRNLSLNRLSYNLAQKRNVLIVSFNELEEVLPDNRIDLSVQDEDLGRIISEFLKTEPTDERNVFIRKYWFFDSIRDISERYAFSESKVKAMLYRVRKRLKAHLKKEGVYFD